MYAFGWTIEYVLALKWPVFIELFGLIHRARCDAGFDEMYLPYCAGKYGKESTEFLLEGRGGFYLDDKPKAMTYSPEAEKLADERLARIIAMQDKKLAKAAKGEHR